MLITLTPYQLSFAEVMSLLRLCDNSFTPTLSSHINLDAYARRLSANAFFVLVKDDAGTNKAFAAYYLNQDGCFAYIPEIWVADDCQRMGLGHKMLRQLVNLVPDYVTAIRLEVRKNNRKAYRFYLKEKFKVLEDRDTKVLLEKKLYNG